LPLHRFCLFIKYFSIGQRTSPGKVRGFSTLTSPELVFFWGGKRLNGECWFLLRIYLPCLERILTMLVLARRLHEKVLKKSWIAPTLRSQQLPAEHPGSCAPLNSAVRLTPLHQVFNAQAEMRHDGVRVRLRARFTACSGSVCNHLRLHKYPGGFRAVPNRKVSGGRHRTQRRTRQGVGPRVPCPW
jgi:hypothetical protein